VESSVDGDNILYKLLSGLIDQGGAESEWLIRHSVELCSVWWDPKVYESTPVLIPWAVRDPESRGNPGKGLSDQWGSPNHEGYFRDDNSLVKGLVKSLPVIGPKSSYTNGKRLGTGWVAAHIWRTNGSSVLASRDPKLYTFVPNLVWLPRQIAKLSDIEGSPVQRALKSISWSLYRDTSLVPGKHRIAERSWKYLPDPEKPTDIDVANLSFFGSPDKTVRMRLQRTYEVLDALRTLERSKPLTTKVVSGRYTAGLNDVASPKRVELARELEKHLQED
jgi:hypothetical protein